MKMKRKNGIAGLLVLVMLLSLAACGKDNDKPVSPAVTGVPEYTYAPEFHTLREGESDSFLSPLLFTDEGFYAFSNERVGEEIPEGVVPEYEGQYAIYENKYYFISLAGEVTPLEKYVPIAAAENTGDYAFFDSGSNVYAMLENGDGNLLVLENVYSSWYEGPEEVEQYSEEYWKNYKRNSDYYLRFLNPDCSEISRVQIEALGEGFYLNGNNVVLDEQGNLLLSYNSDDGWGLIAFRMDGTVAYKQEAEDYVDSVVRLKDGRVAAMSWTQRGLELRTVDSETGKFGEALVVPDQAYNLIPGSGDYDFYYTSGIKLYGYSLETEESTELINWISCDVNTSYLTQTWVQPDGTVIGVINEWNYSNSSNGATTVSSELAVVKKVPYDSVEHKEALTLAVQYMDSNIRRAVIAFNRSSDKYRIDITDYSEYNTEDDYSAGLTKLTTELLAGTMPDLLLLDELPYTQLAAKGLLADLYPYLDEDPELGREDFFENILGAMEVNGGMYQVSSGFGLITVMGASSIVGEEPGWTYEELYAALDTMPEGCEIFGLGMTKEEVLLFCLFMNMDSLIDWSDGKCSFDSPDFIKMLEFSNHFADDYDFSNYDPAVDSEEARISQGRQMLQAISVSDFSDIQYNDFYFGGQGSTTYIGFPTSDGHSGSAIMLDTGVAMSANCLHKDAGWDFLRTFLTEEYQSRGYSLPTNRKEFERQLQAEATPRYKTDAQGNYLLDENGERIEESRGGMASTDGFSVDFYALTQEQVDKLMALVENTQNVIQVNQNIYDLIKQEAQSYFAGQKTVEEVARLIQSKVNIYVNEQK